MYMQFKTRKIEQKTMIKENQNLSTIFKMYRTFLI